jgi:amidase
MSPARRPPKGSRRWPTPTRVGMLPSLSVSRLPAASRSAVPISPNGAVRWHCESELWGAIVNPWDRSRTPGASSAGEAAAIAAGMSPLGLGNDGFKSLRHPAQCCGVAALKPTLGRIPHRSSVDAGADVAIGIQLTAVNGPLARRVADLWGAFEVISGPTWRDPWTVPAPLRGREAGKPIQVAVVLDPPATEPRSRCRTAFARPPRLSRTRAAPSTRSSRRSSMRAAQALVVMLSTPGIRAVWQQVMPWLPDATRRFLTALFEAVGNPDEVATEQSFITRQSVLRSWGEFQETYPLIVAPIATNIPSMAGTDLDEGRVAADLRTMRMAIAVNALGLPAVAVPAGVQDGLPQAVQVIGPRYREDLCLDAAAMIEDRLGVITPIDPR